MFCPEYDTLDDPAERQRWREAMTARRYSRWPVGPIWEDPSYDGNYPPTNWLADQAPFLARMGELRDSGFLLNLHAIPDNGRFPDGTPDFDWLNRVLAPIYQQPGFQAFTEVTIAWEPNWRNAIWVLACQWVRQQFPNAWIWVHLPPDKSAPGMGDEDEGACWRNVAPFVNGCRYQSGQFGSSSTGNTRTPLQQFLYDVWNVARHFAEGLNGWPRLGFNGQPLLCQAAEYVSYWVYHGLATEQEALIWGAAVQHTPPYVDPETGDLIDLQVYHLIAGDGGLPTRPVAG